MSVQIVLDQDTSNIKINLGLNFSPVWETTP